MTLLQSLIRLINSKAVQNETREAAASGEMHLLSWHTSEEEKVWGDIEDAIGNSLEKVQINK
ncbi:hypothetical protein OAM69_05690 [bacterium]|nr:hypothetical protein [bacterium]